MGSIELNIDGKTPAALAEELLALSKEHPSSYIDVEVIDDGYYQPSPSACITLQGCNIKPVPPPVYEPKFLRVHGNYAGATDLYYYDKLIGFTRWIRNGNMTTQRHYWYLEIHGPRGDLFLFIRKIIGSNRDATPVFKAVEEAGWDLNEINWANSKCGGPHSIPKAQR